MLLITSRIGGSLTTEKRWLPAWPLKRNDAGEFDVEALSAQVLVTCFCRNQYLRRKTMPNPFVHVELNSNDVNKAKSFYQKLFDWELEDVPSPTPAGAYTMIKV